MVALSRLGDAAFDDNAGALRVAMGSLDREHEIAAGDSGSQFAVPLSKQFPFISDLYHRIDRRNHL